MRAVAMMAVAMTLAGGAQAKPPEIAFTWDDLPAHGPLPEGETRVAIGDRLTEAWKAAGMPPAYGFTNGVRTEEEPGSAEMLDHWRAAGLPLGNHAWSHMNLATHSAAEFEEDVVKGEATIAGRMAGQDWHWFRYPNLSEGDTPEKKAEVRRFLAARGYRIAGVTMSFGDYLWTDPYARCVAKGDQPAIDWLARSYLAAAAENASYTRTLYRSVYGRDIPYVLLMHVGALDSRVLPQLIAMYRAQGFRFVTLEQAQRHPYYRGYMDPRLPQAPERAEDVAKRKNIALPPRHNYAPELQTICR